MDTDKQEETIVCVLHSILLAKLYTDLHGKSSNVRIPRDTNICLALKYKEVCVKQYYNLFSACVNYPLLS